VCYLYYFIIFIHYFCFISIRVHILFIHYFCFINKNIF